MIDKTPKVFFSYSWTSKEYQESIIALATRMRHEGVDVKLDVWDLKEGQDKYAYMEQCVSDDSVDKVLILSDKLYTSKADGRKGGVGDETTIISAEIYGNVDQNKFIPVVMERDDNGREYLPIYLKSRIYRDLSGDDYEVEYRALLRTIFEEPVFQKPQIGKPPEWLKKEIPEAVYTLKKASKNVVLSESRKMNATSIRGFIDIYIEAIKPFYNEKVDEDIYSKSFSEMKEYRNAFLDYVNNVSKTENFGSIMADEFERMYNVLYNIETFKPGASSCSYDEFDLFKLHIWELFVCMTAYMLHNDMYEDIHDLLVHTYFLRSSPLGDEIRPYSYEKFRFYSRVLEDRIKPYLAEPLSKKYTLTGHYIVSERTYMPIYTSKAIADADLFLYQVYNGLNIERLTESGAWFPTLYIYANQHNSMWKKLCSKRFCQKVMPIFGVETVAAFKKAISKCVEDKNYRYAWALSGPSSILTWINFEDIATLP